MAADCRLRVPFALALVTVVSAAACATHAHRPPDTQPGVQVITAEQIARSGGNTAWDVLKREAPMLRLRENRNGRPTAAGRRGPASILLEDAVVVILDGVRLPDFRALDGIPAVTIFTISIYTGIEGTTYYGTNAVSGVVVIETKAGRES